MGTSKAPEVDGDAAGDVEQERGPASPAADQIDAGDPQKVEKLTKFGHPDDPDAGSD